MLCLLLLFWQLISLSAFDFFVFVLFFGYHFCNGTKDQRKLIQTNFFTWIDLKKEVISLIESHGNYFNCQIVSLLLSDLCCFLHLIFSCVGSFFASFFWPLSKKCSIRQFNLKRKIDGVMARSSVSKSKFCVSSFHDLFLLTFDFCVSRRMQRINF